MSIRIERYNAGFSSEWDIFVRESKNGFFMFERAYMDYHAERFTDHSLLFFSRNKLIALLPANQSGNQLSSHGGLTFGGLILSKPVFIKEVEAVFEALQAYLKANDFQALLYKAIPYIYHELPAQEDLFFLVQLGAQLQKRAVNSVIDLSQKLTYTKGIKHNIAKGRKSRLVIKESADFETFMAIETEILKNKFNTKPTHSAAEIEMLAGRFPKNIKLYLVYKEQECLGGSIMYYSGQVMHMQYAGFNATGQKVGAFAFLTDYFIHNLSEGFRFFSFGISTNHQDNALNEGLVFVKESFRARTVVQDTYLLPVR